MFTRSIPLGMIFSIFSLQLLIQLVYVCAVDALVHSGKVVRRIIVPESFLVEKCGGVRRRVPLPHKNDTM